MVETMGSTLPRGPMRARTVGRLGRDVFGDRVRRMAVRRRLGEVARDAALETLRAAPTPVTFFDTRT